MVANISRNVEVLEGNVGGYPLIAVVMAGLRNHESKHLTPWFLSISTPFVVSAQGLPTSEEVVGLDQWEQLIEGEIAGLATVMRIGRVTWNGRRELLYYVDSPERASSRLRSLMRCDGVRQFDFQCNQDDDWHNVEMYVTHQ